MIRLIDNWRQLWRSFSMQSSVLGASIIGAYSAMPEEFKHEIPAKYVLWAAGITFVFGAIGRMVHQPVLQPKDEAQK